MLSHATSGGWTLAAMQDVAVGGLDHRPAGCVMLPSLV